VDLTKLRKTETVDKSQLSVKEDVQEEETEQYERLGKLFSDITKGGGRRWDLKRTVTNDKSKVNIVELESQIILEKEANKEEAHRKPEESGEQKEEESEQKENEIEKNKENIYLSRIELLIQEVSMEEGSLKKEYPKKTEAEGQPSTSTNSEDGQNSLEKKMKK